MGYFWLIMKIGKGQMLFGSISLYLGALFQYNGIPLQKYDLQAYRDHCTAVFQDFVRYEESFQCNVTFGEWMEHDHSVQKAKLTQLMQTLPEKKIPNWGVCLVGRIFQEDSGNGSLLREH